MSKTSLPIDAEAFQDLHMPRAGLDVSRAFSKQPNRPVTPDNIYARTCVVGVNCRGYEPDTFRARGGNRSGLSKWNASAVVADWIVQGLALLVGPDFLAPGGNMQTSQSGRTVILTAVSQGNVYTAAAGDSGWVQALNSTGESPPLVFTGPVSSTQLNQKLWFADGTNYCYYDPVDNTVKAWVASDGTLPADSADNTPRLIATWRGRIVLSGLIYDPQNWFMSAVADSTNFNYSGTTNPDGTISPTPTQAIAGNNSPLGLIGDVVTALIPYTDDVLIFGGDHTIYMMRGDPMAGGQIDRISDAIGMAWNTAWCKDPYGNVYFLSNKCGIYVMSPQNGFIPQRISQPIEPLIQLIDTGTNAINLIWNDRFQGLHVFITGTAQPAAATHYFFEQRSGAWWQDTFANNNHNPICCVTYDGNLPGDRAVLIGSWDGYVRAVDPTATDDDGSSISSSVMIGPLLTKDLDDVLLKDLAIVLGSNSGDVTMTIYVGNAAEAASVASAFATYTVSAGRNVMKFVRAAGHAIYIKLASTVPWSMEVISARIALMGKVRRRNQGN